MRPTPGMRFGKLVIKERVPGLKSKSTIWRCDCDCGGSIVTTWDCIRRKTRSCGCLYFGRQNNLTHGLTQTNEYRIWAGMQQRCSNPNRPEYPNYGGRGIRVCERWGDFELFLGDMGPRPGLEYSIDRINNDGNYEPGNCRWATKSEQQSNRRVCK